MVLIVYKKVIMYNQFFILIDHTSITRKVLPRWKQIKVVVVDRAGMASWYSVDIFKVWFW